MADYKKKNARRNFSKFKSSQSGQSLVLAMGLFLVASVTAFLVFNSGRAVNEKINLVSAADAAAYSGAQIAARQLNFMAYTNRAMMANEVSVGHFLSYQMELDIVTELAQQALTIPDTPLMDFLIWVADFFIKGDLRGMIDQTSATLAQIFDVVGNITQGVTGIYALTVDANNAYFSTLQQEALKDFAYPDRGSPLIQVAMQEVVKDYELRPNATSIVLNDPVMLQTFANDSNSSAGIRNAASQALQMNKQFCQLVMFVRPGAGTATSVGVGNDMAAFCDAIKAGSIAGGPGSPANPMADQGAMLEILQSTVLNFSNAEWIRNRKSDYYLIPLMQVNRTGSTAVVVENGQLNWKSQGDSLSVSVGVQGFSLPLTTVDASGDIVGLSEEVGNYIDGNVRNWLETYELCGGTTGIDCDALAGGSYKGVRSYTYLNPNFVRPRVTAFLRQNKCRDNIGVDDAGNNLAGWNDNLKRFDEAKPMCSGSVYAVSQAEVFYQRPACSNSANCAFGFASTGITAEKPNLFNPFWQVRIIASAGD